MVEPFHKYWFSCPDCYQMVYGELEELSDDIFLITKGCQHFRRGTRMYLPDIEPELSEVKRPTFPPKISEWQPGTPFKEPPLPRWTLEPKILKFTAQILGDRGSHDLLTKTTSQTIRSATSLTGISIGDVVGVSLDNRPVGKARITSIEEETLSHLDVDDAERGGFGTLEELHAALRRAGYRFKPLEEYTANRVQFEWL